MHVERPFTTPDCKLGGKHRALAGLLGGVSDPKRIFVSNRSNIWTRSSNTMGGIGSASSHRFSHVSFGNSTPPFSRTWLHPPGIWSRDVWCILCPRLAVPARILRLHGGANRSHLHHLRLHPAALVHGPMLSRLTPCLAAFRHGGPCTRA